MGMAQGRGVHFTQPLGAQRFTASTRCISSTPAARPSRGSTTGRPPSKSSTPPTPDSSWPTPGCSRDGPDNGITTKGNADVRVEEVHAVWGQYPDGDGPAAVVAIRQADTTDGRPTWVIYPDDGSDVELPRLSIIGDRYDAERVVKVLAESFAALEREHTGVML